MKPVSAGAAHPYRGQDQRPVLRTSVAAFIDILGYQEYIKKAFAEGRGNEELGRLRNAVDSSLQHIKKHANDVTFGGTASFVVRSFTDNLIIGYPFSDQYEGVGMGCLMIVIDFISFIQAQLGREGYFVRGGISAGDLYVDDDIIFGPALLEAYEAEQKHAVNPRVILCKSAQELFKGRHFGFHDRPVPDVLLDPDGRVFVDYLENTVMIAGGDDRPFVEFLEQRIQIIARLDEFKRNPYVRSKYEWAARYHNHFCDRHKGFCDESLRIPESLLEQSPEPWIALPKPTSTEQSDPPFRT